LHPYILAREIDQPTAIAAKVSIGARRATASMGRACRVATMVDAHRSWSLHRRWQCRIKLPGSQQVLRAFPCGELFRVDLRDFLDGRAGRREARAGVTRLIDTSRLRPYKRELFDAVTPTQ
jgi:hypothetical protein